MAQRWLQAKEMLARKHGVARSGANRPMGDVMDDYLPRFYTEPKPASTKRKNGTATVLKSNRPKAWTYTGADAFTC
jgi:hypothetical protein